VVDKISDAEGTIFPVLADGFYLMLRPLPPGPHIISFGGKFFGNAIDVTYDITVQDKAQVRPAVMIPGPTVLATCAVPEHGE
jgi:hypothetical protein